MAISARELVFYIRAEDQASRVIRRAARNIGSLSNIKSVQKSIGEQNIKNAQAVSRAQQQIRRNESAIEQIEARRLQINSQLLTAQRRYSQMLRASPGKGALRGMTAEESAMAIAAQRNAILGLQAAQQGALHTAATLNREEELLAANLSEVERRAAAASAALDLELQEAHIQRTERIASGFQQAGRAARLFGIAAVAALAFAAHAAANFQTQLTLAASQARPLGAGPQATARISTRIQDVVLKQMQQFPAASQDMADSLYQIFSSTNIQNIPQAAQYLTLFNKAAVAGGADLKSMTDAGISLLNNFVGVNQEFKTLTPAMQRFFSAVRFGRMNAQQFAQSLPFVAGIAKEAGLGFTDIADAMAVLTRQTGARYSTRDAQGLARLIQQFSNPDAIAGMKQLGIQAIDPLTNKLKPLLDIITQISQKANLKGVNALNFFKSITAAGGGGAGNKGTIQAQRAFAYLVNNIKEYRHVAGQVNKDNNEMTMSFKALSKSPGVQWATLVNQFKALAIVVGRSAIPAFVSMFGWVGKVVKWFNGLSDSTKHTIGYFAAFSAVGLVVGGTIVVLSGALFKLYLTLKLLSVVKMAGLAEDAGAINVKFALMLGAIGAIIYILIRYHKQLDQVIKAMGGLKTIIPIVTASLLIMTYRLESAGVAALSADSKVAGLITRLSRLALIAIPTLIIPVAFKDSKSVVNSPPGTPHIKTAGGILGSIEQLSLGGDVAFRKHILGQTTQQAVAATIKDTRGKLFNIGSIQYTQAPQSVLKQLAEISNSPWTNNDIMSKAMAAYHAGKYDIVKQLWQAVVQGPKSYAQGLVGTIQTKGSALAQTLGGVAAAALAKDAASIKAQSTWDRLFKNVIRLDKIVKSAKMPTLKQITALLDAEDKLQKASKGNQYSAAQQYLSALESLWSGAEKTAQKHAKNILKIEKQNAANARNELQSLLGNVQSMYDNFLQQNQSNFGQIFSGPVVNGALFQNEVQFGGKISGPVALRDLKAQLFQFNRFNKDVAAFAKRGAPKSLIDQLQAMGPAGKDNIKALMQLSPAQWKEYINTWDKSQTAIKNATMRQLDSQLKIYESHGRKIALAIIKGVKSENIALSNTLEGIIEKMFPGLTKQARLPHTTPRISLPGKVSGKEEHTHFHLPPNHTADTETQLRHLSFRLMNKFSPFG